MRVGIARGRKHEMKRTYTFGVSALIVAAAAIFIIFSISGSPFKALKEDAVQTASANSVSDFESFRSIAQRDQGFAAALEQGLMKPIKQGVEKNGYRMDVAGAVTDGRRAYVMYSFQNHTDSDVIPIVDAIIFGETETPSIGAEICIAMGNNVVSSGQTSYFVFKTDLLSSADYKKDAQFSIKLWNNATSKYQKVLNVKFDLEPNLLKDKERVFNTEGTMKVDGQNIKVKQVSFTPLNTYVDLEYDKNNDKQIFKMINPVLIGEKGDHIEKLYYPEYMPTLDPSKTTLVFKTNKFDQLDSASLKVFGIGAVKKDQLKVVVDINKKQIVEAPDDNFTIIQPDEKVGEGEMIFQHRLENAQVADSIGMWLDDSYTDAAGEEHKRLPSVNVSHGGTTTSSKEDTQVDETAYNFGKEALNYPQPLTIGVKRYWIPIMETQTQELLSKNKN